VFDLANAGDGFDSTCSNIISQTEFTALFAATPSSVKSFYGKYFDGALVSNPLDYSQLHAACNTNCMHSMKNAKAAGIYSAPTGKCDAWHVPKYVAPGTKINCPFYKLDAIKCQAVTPIHKLNGICTPDCIGTTWLYLKSLLSVSGWGSGPTAKADNEAFITAFVKLFGDKTVFSGSLGPRVGIFTTKADWDLIVRSTYTIPNDGAGAQPLLWWSRCSSPPDNTYNGFEQFGGWTTPSQVQYDCTKTDIAGQPNADGDMVYWP
jgi:hypothetical protein